MRHRFLTAVVLTMTMALSLAAPAAAADPDPGQAVTTGNVPTTRYAAATSYWTETRTRRARPMPAASPSRVRPRVVRVSRVGGQPGRVSGSMPWILALGRGNYINGLVSYGYESQSEALYGPYFSADTNALRCSAATGNASATTC